MNEEIEASYGFPNELFYNEEKLNVYLLKLKEEADIKLNEKLKLREKILEEQEEKERQEYDRLSLKFNKNENLK